MAELVDAADSKSVFERSGSSSLPRGTILKKDLEIQGLFFRLKKSGRWLASAVLAAIATTQSVGIR